MMLKSDNRYSAFGSDDAERQQVFEKHQQLRYEKAKVDFKTLLKETKCITHKSVEQIQEEKNPHLREIMQALEVGFFN